MSSSADADLENPAELGNNSREAGYREVGKR
jgi:hypothetical protein